MSTAEVIAQKIFKAYGDNAYHIPRELHDRIDHIAKNFSNAGYIKSALLKGIDTTPGSSITYKLVIAASLKDTAIQRALQRKQGYKHEFGWTKVALQLGSNLIEWREDSLVKIRKVTSRDADVALDLSISPVMPMSLTAPDVDALVTKVALVVVEWNASKQYDDVHANSQDFITNLCSHGIGVDLRKYLVAIKEDANNARPHYYDKDGKRVFFEDHKHLDQYYKANETFLKVHHQDQIALLKAFDRAYLFKWNYWRDYKPVNNNEVTLCTEQRHIKKYGMFGCTAFGPVTSKQPENNTAFYNYYQDYLKDCFWDDDTLSTDSVYNNSAPQTLDPPQTATEVQIVAPAQISAILDGFDALFSPDDVNFDVPPEDLEAANQAITQNWKEITEIDGFMSAEAGLKVRGGVALNTLSIRIRVNQKKQKEAIKGNMVKETYGGVITDVFAGDYEDWGRLPVTPIHSGLQIGRLKQPDAENTTKPTDKSLKFPKKAKGTIGCFIKLTGARDGELDGNYMLTNDHVVPIGTRYGQPREAAIPNSYVNCGVSIFSKYNDELDYSICTFNRPATEIFSTQQKKLIEGKPTLGHVVQKFGRSTNWTKGRIGSLEERRKDKHGNSIYYKMVKVDPLPAGTTFGKEGDSGAAIIERVKDTVAIVAILNGAAGNEGDDLKAGRGTDISFIFDDIKSTFGGQVELCVGSNIEGKVIDSATLTLALSAGNRDGSAPSISPEEDMDEENNLL